MTDLKTQSIAEVHKQITDNREALRVGRFGGAGSRSRDVRAARMLRRQTARLLTELHARELAEKQKKA